LSWMHNISSDESEHQYIQSGQSKATAGDTDIIITSSVISHIQKQAYLTQV